MPWTCIKLVELQIAFIYTLLSVLYHSRFLCSTVCHRTRPCRKLSVKVNERIICCPVKLINHFRSFKPENLISCLCYRELFNLIFLLRYYVLQGIYHRLGDVFMRLKKWSEAERFHRAALEAEPNHIGAHISFGTMLARNVSIVSCYDVWWIGLIFKNFSLPLPHRLRKFRVVDHRKQNNISNEQFV